MTNFDRNGVSSVCRIYDPFDTVYMPVPILLKHVVNWDYTHLLLFLSPSDVFAIKDYLTMTSSEKIFHLFTSFPKRHALLTDQVSNVASAKWNESHKILFDEAILEEIKKSGDQEKPLR